MVDYINDPWEYRWPCKGCRFLIVADRQNHRCDWQPVPHPKVGYWIDGIIPPKGLEGPFTSDAMQLTCDVREDA